MSKCALPLAALAGLATVSGSLLGAVSGATASTAYADTNTNGNSQVDARLVSNYVTVTTDGTVNIEVVPTSAGSMAVGKSTVNVKTNSEEGYRLFVSGVKHDENSTAAPLYFNGNASSSARLAAVGSTPAAFSTKNTWGYAVPSVSGAGYSDASKYASAATSGTIVDALTISNLKWKGMSTDYAQVKTSNTKNEAGDPIDVYYGVYVDTNTISGNYLNTVVYTAFVEGSDNVEISKATLKNGEQNVDVTVEYQSADRPVVLSGANKNAEATVQLINRAAGNAVVGECNGLTAVNDGSAAQLKLRCASITAKNSPANNTPYDVAVTLRFDDGMELAYASSTGIWKYNNTLADITTMQQMSASICAATPGYASNSATYNLTDERDGKKYAVRKLADNECWMVQNLDLDLVYDPATNSMGTKLGNSFNPFTKDNTNIANSSWTIPSGSQGYTTQTATGVYWNQWGCANSSYSATWAASGANKYDVSTWCATGYEVRSYDEGNNCVTVSAAASGTDTIAACDTTLGSANTKHAGNMYNWVAATAGTGTYATTSGEASGSICPKGWRLPYGGAVSTPKSWYNMLNKYTTMTHGIAQSTATWAALTGAPVSEVRAGYYYFGTAALDNRGTGGYGWASTANSAQNGYRLHFGQSFVYPGTLGSNKGFGLQLRCVAQ